MCYIKIAVVLKYCIFICDYGLLFGMKNEIERSTIISKSDRFFGPWAYTILKPKSNKETNSLVMISRHVVLVLYSWLRASPLIGCVNSIRPGASALNFDVVVGGGAGTAEQQRL